MANLYATIMDESAFIKNLEDDLEGTLCCIAFAGKHKDEKFIRGRQKWIREKYDAPLDRFSSLTDFYLSTTYLLMEVYDGFMDFLTANHADCEEIREKAKEFVTYLNTDSEEIEETKALRK